TNRRGRHAIASFGRESTYPVARASLRRAHRTHRFGATHTDLGSVARRAKARHLGTISPRGTNEAGPSARATHDVTRTASAKGAMRPVPGRRREACCNTAEGTWVAVIGFEP